MNKNLKNRIVLLVTLAVVSSPIIIGIVKLLAMVPDPSTINF